MNFTHAANHQVIFFPDEVQTLFPGQPYLYRISYQDWTNGYQQIMHSHADLTEILLLLAGSGCYSIGAQRYPVQAGDVILCNGGTVHDEFPNTRETYQTLCLGIKNLCLPDLPPNHIIAHNKTPIFHHPAQFDDLSALLQIMMRQAQAQAPSYLSICQQLMQCVLELTAQMIAAQSADIDPQQNQLCAQVEAYIYQHYSEDLTIEQLGKLFFVSPYHLAHVFKQHTGYTLKQYILRRRIGEAQDRLSYSSDSITQIARDVGFADSAYFSRIFTKYVGMSPKYYREYRTKSEDSQESLS